MKLDEFYSAVTTKLKLPTAYREFSEEEAETLTTPYIVYFVDSSNSFIADNIVYYLEEIIMFEIYTDFKDIELESKVELWLLENEFVWEKEEAHVPEESLYITYYTFKL